MCCQYQFQRARRGRLAWGWGDGLGYIFSLWWLALHQRGWAMVPRYVVKHSECFCKAIWGCFKLHLNWWKFERADCPPTCGWASSNQLKAWLEQKAWSPPCKWDFCSRQPSDLNGNSSSSCISSLPAHIADFGLASLCNYINQFSQLHELEEVEWWCRVGQDRSPGEWC